MKAHYAYLERSKETILVFSKCSWAAGVLLPLKMVAHKSPTFVPAVGNHTTVILPLRWPPAGVHPQADRPSGLNSIFSHSPLDGTAG